MAQHALFEDDLARALADLNGLAYRDLELDPPDPDVSRFVPEAFCRRRGVLLVALDGDSLLVAISDPLDLQTFDDLRTLTEVPLIPVMATPSGLREAIEVGYARHLLDADDHFDSSESGDLTRGAADNLRDPAVVGRNDRPVVEFVNPMLRRAVSDRASDVHLEPTSGSLGIRFRVDGMLRDAMDAPASFERAVISRIKVMADMDISNHRRPQDGRMSLRIDDLAIDLRAATIPTINGEAVVLRLLIRDTSLLHIDGLGFGPGPLDAFKAALRRPWGMILVTGPTGSGKSTTLYAGLNELNSPSRNTVTIEDPIEYRVAGIKQTQLDPGVGYTFASGLRAVVRADPDVILVGEIRDLETARLASEAALTGHLVLSTLHANDAASRTTRLLDMGLPPYLVTSTLECVVSQRLVRRLCARCKSSRRRPQKSSVSSRRSASSRRPPRRCHSRGRSVANTAEGPATTGGSPFRR